MGIIEKFCLLFYRPKKERMIDNDLVFNKTENMFADLVDKNIGTNKDLLGKSTINILLKIDLDIESLEKICKYYKEIEKYIFDCCMTKKDVQFCIYGKHIGNEKIKAFANDVIGFIYEHKLTSFDYYSTISDFSDTVYDVDFLGFLIDEEEANIFYNHYADIIRNIGYKMDMFFSEWQEQSGNEPIRKVRRLDAIGIEKI